MVTRIALVVLAAVATLPIVSAAGAVVFGLVALLVATTARATHRASWPIVGATVVAAAQLVQAVATEWGAAATRTYALALYESVLIAVAVGAIVADRRRRSRLRSRLGSQVVDGVDVYARLGELLGAAVGDPTLRIEPAVDARAEPTPLLTPVVDDGVVLAVIAHGSGALDDAPTARALTEAVRLVARHERLLAQQRRSADELVAARSRLLDAEERERARLGALIRRDVTSPVAAVADRLRGRATEPGAVAQTLDTVVTELDSAVSEAAMLVAGLPALPLGDGRIHEALAALAERSPLPVVLHLAPEATGDSGAEAAAYAVCAEALTNAIKHADARRLSIDLAVVGDDLVVTTTDDGRGGADPSGSGLSGLAERVAARGGSFQVASSDGRGTRSHAVIPRVSQPIRA
jgi:signal transduction histidine kinase